MRNIDVNMSLKNTPRPVYLIGEAKYEISTGEYRLLANVYFPTSTVSIGDRVNGHAVPHVNIADAFFGVWNGVHIICNEEGYHGALSSKGEYKSFIPIPGDKEISLELIIRNLEDVKEGRFDVSVDFEALYKHNSRTLMKLSGEGYAIRDII